jgi:diketogulonate reductase-like aldo/keto reductase
LIVTEAYSALIPLTTYPEGPVTKPLSEISKKRNLKPEQILLAWVRSKGAVIVTSSSKKERLEGYLAVGEIELTKDEIEAIDVAGQGGIPTIVEVREMVGEVIEQVKSGKQGLGWMGKVVVGIAAGVGAGVLWMLTKA